MHMKLPSSAYQETSYLWQSKEPIVVVLLILSKKEFWLCNSNDNIFQVSKRTSWKYSCQLGIYKNKNNQLDIL